MEFGISFGCLADSLADQVRKFGYKFDDNKIVLFQKQKDAIHTLAFGSLITDSEADRCFKKLYRKIESHICKENNLQKKARV